MSTDRILESIPSLDSTESLQCDKAIPLTERTSESTARPESKIEGQPKVVKESLFWRISDTVVLLIRLWAWELFCLAIAGAMFAALIIVLLVQEHKPAPQWSGGITLNTLISVASTIFRFSIMLPVSRAISQSTWLWLRNRRSLDTVSWFDHASRGPAGSFLLLGRIRLGHYVCIGAVITILTLALDPFFQQTLRYEVQPSIDPTQAAQTVAAYGFNGTTGVVHELSSAQVDEPFDLKAAMYSGLLSANMLTVPDPPYECSSGNCTWDPFSSLAINSACSDITSSVKLDCGPFPYGAKTPNNYCNFTSPDDIPLQTMLNHSQPNEYLIMKTSLISQFLPALVPYANVTGAMVVVQWVKVLNPLAQIATFESLSVPYITPNTSYEAGRCMFYLSVQQIQASVTNGAYKEEVLEEFTHIPNDTAQATYEWNGNNFYTRDPWDTSQDLVYEPPFAPGTKFTVPWRNYEILISGFGPGNEWLTGNVSTGSSQGFSGPQYPLMLLQADNMTRGLENMAHYMTTALRANDTLLLRRATQDADVIAPSQAVQGAVWVQTQFVLVMWKWLALPAVVLAAAALFLFAVIWETHATGLGVWKHSPLTLLFQAVLRDEIPLPLEELTTKSGMQVAAQRMHARVTHEGGVRVSMG